MDSSIEKEASKTATDVTASTGGDSGPPQGVESPVEAAAKPAHSKRGTRAMAIVRWALLGLVSVAAVYNVATMWGPAHSHEQARPDHYYCSMHPQIRSPDPGTCPICHMDLVPIPEDRQQGPSAPSGQPAMGAAMPMNSADPAGNVAPTGLQTVTLSEERQHLFGITLAPVTAGVMANRLRVPASVEVPRSGVAEVRVRAPGFIESVAVRETGIRVKKGQILASMWSPDIYRAEEEMIAAHKMAEGPAAAITGNTGKEMVAASRRGLELLGVSQKAMDDMIRTGHAARNVGISAPISGVVTKAYAVLGTRAMPEVALYEIADLSKVWVVASVQERDLPSVKTGMLADFTASNRGGGEARKAKVDLVEPDVSPTTRAVRVRFTVENKDYDLRPGQLGEIAFELPEEKALSVPRDAVVDTGKAQYVFVAVGADSFEPRLVKTGSLIEDRLQITSGVKEGEKVVARGSFLIDSESRLRASLDSAGSSTTAGK